ncbi:flavodoxin FldA [Synechococcus sp. ATX 2A4]|uniref:flavodoxin FldA n=1 Tax=Synechococcus sp. ATX 2A4 TaxID=2823727 RepID=UPI0020CB8C71|nr:flavodoxin FldA [Synechococcus sp. ATX 2A4]MCP9885834.1 flavodoxin FldA [Synechococcus sp. ATX 2A4]
MPVRILFATTTGKTEDVATRLAELIGSTANVEDVGDLDATEQLEEPGDLICCVPTWNTGADSMRSGTAWDSHVEAIPDLQLTGRSVAIVGLGDSSSYSDYFCDAMEELYTAFIQAGASLVGKVSPDGYNFSESKSVVDGMFCGLALDEDSEPDLTDDRLVQWVKQLRKEAPGMF